MSASDLTSIPLPVGPGSAVTGKKSVDTRQVPAKNHTNVLSTGPAVASGDASNKLNTSSDSILTSAGLDGKESSQRIVDQLFKDFIAQKITSSSRVSKDVRDDKMVSRVRNSADEISKLLDMEIMSIQSSTENKEKLSDRKDQRSSSLTKQSKFIPVAGSTKEGRRSNDHILSPKSDPVLSPKSDPVLSLKSDAASLGSKNEGLVFSSANITDVIKCQSTANDNTHIPTTAGTVSTTAILASTTQSKDSSQPPVGGSALNIKKNVMLPVSLAKKLMQPKVLGVKLSSQSLSLITSKDRIDRDGRVWEEGEVCSSGSESLGKDKASDSGADGLPSDSGSIHSNIEDRKSQTSKHKKKHKHRHKKKKKKSSKEKDLEKDMEKDTRKSKDTDEKDQEKSKTHCKGDKVNDKDKDRDDTKMDKDRTKEDSEKHSKDKHTSSDHDQELKRKKKDSDKKRERSHSRSPKRRRKSKSRTRSRSKSPKRHRSRSRSSSPKSHGSGRYGEWDARRYSNDTSRSRSKSKERHRRSRDRSKSCERDRSKESKDRDLRVKIDKSKLRKIAIANALQNMKAGQGPQLDLTLVKSGGKSVEELTEFCKRISEKSKADNGDDDSSDEDTAKKSDEEEMLIHHPFKVKEASSTGIVMNIRNAKQLPILTPPEKQAQQATLRLTFPVSSGSHHRASESEWVPVVKAGPTVPVAQPAPSVQVTNVTEPPVVPQPSANSIFPDVSEAQKIDIGSIISERLQAVRKLQENPYDMQALSQMHQVQQQASKWATSRHLPGQFMGSTGAHVLTQEQLIGDRRHQAWAKKTQLSHAAPVHGGIGMFLLQKMGWKQGEGLGKNNEGSKEPLMLDIKVDRRGLTTAAENPRHRPQAAPAAPRAKDLSNKHPVSALMELCNRRRWGPPLFTVVSESGPDHKKDFLFKVRVNNVEYQPASPSSNKKTAKALCAAVCLQEMGLLPRDAPLNI